MAHGSLELTWFRRPSGDHPGTLNLCFNALDLQVVRGHAADPAVLAAKDLDFATVLERVSALGGALLGLGVTTGERVHVERTDWLDHVLLLLACLRIGAVYVEPPHVGEAAIEITDDHDLREVEKAGRQDPAECAVLSPDAVAFVADGEPVSLLDALRHPSAPGLVVQSLCAGKPVGVATGETT